MMDTTCLAAMFAMIFAIGMFARLTAAPDTALAVMMMPGAALIAAYMRGLWSGRDG